MTRSPQPAGDAGRQLTALHRQAGRLGRLSLILPLLGGGLLVVQASTLASILHAAIIAQATLTTLVGPVAVLLILIAARASLGLIGETLAVRASEAIKLDLRARLFGEMLGRLPIWTASRSSGALSTLVIEQIEALDGFFVRYMPAMLQAAILPIAFAAIILPVDWMVGLIFLVTAPLIPVFMMLAGWGAEAASTAQAGALARLAGRFADRLRGMVTLKLFGREAAETEAAYAASEELRWRSMKVMRVAFVSSAVLEFFAALGVAGVALYVGLTFLGLVNLRADKLTLEAGLFCLLMAPEVYQPLRVLAAHYHDRAAAKAALLEITAALGSLPAPPVNEQSPVAPAARTGGPISIKLGDLAVWAPNGQPVLANVDLELAACGRVAIVGASGIGKSTLLETLARLRPYSGSIMLNGRALEEIEEARLRSDVALLGQRPRIFAGTIAENIRLGRPGACETAVRTAACRALVTDFADELPGGLDTPVGENGLGLSGGEIQRIALARLFLRDPALLLLDEPTAHLDPITEQEVLDNLLQFADGRTLVIATHSLAVAGRMDRALRLVGGKVLPTPLPPLPTATLVRGAA